MAAIVIAATAYLSYVGYAYYKLPIEERFYHPQYDWFKPSGAFGHGLGIVGTLLIVIGVSLYIARKNYGFLERQIRIKYLLEFHIFLCTLGPIMVLFHTSFKFGGIVSISFWSMVAVVASGVIGRFIYIQIPRNISGKDLDRKELEAMQAELRNKLRSQIQFSENELAMLQREGEANSNRQLLDILKSKGIPRATMKEAKSLLRQERILRTRMRNLARMQKLFSYWHIAHKPFALIMLVFALIHVGVTLAFGYRWIF
jgi:hypothetical protein